MLLVIDLLLQNRKGNSGSGSDNDDRSLTPSAIYPVAGALLGTCLGGPVGLLAGVKIGGLAAIGGSVFGKVAAAAVSTVTPATFTTDVKPQFSGLGWSAAKCLQGVYAIFGSLFYFFLKMAMEKVPVKFSYPLFLSAKLVFHCT